MSGQNANYQTQEPEPVTEELVGETPEKTRLFSLAKILRRIGGVVLAVASATFAIQSIQVTDSLERFYYFLGFTGVVTSLAVYLRKRYHDIASAKVLLGLVIVFLGAHFTQLGALFYSLLKQAPETIPSLLILKTSSWSSVILATAATLVVLIPGSALAFSLLVGEQIASLTSLHLLAYSLLLLPIRLPNPIALVALGGVMAITLGNLSMPTKDQQHAKRMRLARMGMYFPIVLLLARTGILYGTTSMFLSVIYGVVGFALFFVPKVLKTSDYFMDFAEFVGLLCISYGWVLFAQGTFFERANCIIPLNYHDWFILVSLMPVALLAVILSIFSNSSGAFYRILGAMLAVVVSVAQLVVVGGVLASFLLIAVSIALIAYAFTVEEKGLLFISTIGLAIGVLYHLRYAIELYTMSPWASLATVGLLTIVTAAYIEQNSTKLIARLKECRAHLDTWK